MKEKTNEAVGVKAILEQAESRLEHRRTLAASTDQQPKKPEISPYLGPGRLATPEIVKEYMYAGKAYITIRSKKTGTRFTYRIFKPETNEKFPNQVWLVSVLNGPDNWSNYQYMGKIDADQKMFQWTSKARVGPEALSWKAFEYLFKALSDAPLFFNGNLEVWHEGKCGRCGRKLTVPESIERGIGPDCAEKM